MKVNLIWRRFAIYALFMIGATSLLFIFSDDNLPWGRWIEIRLYLAIVMYISFSTMSRLIHWENKDKSINNLNKEEYGNQD